MKAAAEKRTSSLDKLARPGYNTEVKASPGEDLPNAAPEEKRGQKRPLSIIEDIQPPSSTTAETPKAAIQPPIRKRQKQVPNLFIPKPNKVRGHSQWSW